jgi:hypothetical protein
MSCRAKQHDPADRTLESAGSSFYFGEIRWSGLRFSEVYTSVLLKFPKIEYNKANAFISGGK